MKPRVLGRARTTAALTGRTIAFVFRREPFTIALIGALTLLVAALPILIAYVGKEIIDGVVAGSTERALRWVVIELGVVVVQAIGQRALALVRGLLGSRLALTVNVLILEKALTLELRHFENGAFYDRLTRARNEASMRPISVVTQGFQLVQNALTLVGYLALIVHYSPWVALGLALAAVPASLVEIWFSRSRFKMRNWRSPQSRRLNYLEYVVANDYHAKEVKLLGIGPYLLDRYRAIGESFLRDDRRLGQRQAFWGLVLSLIGTGAFYLCYVSMGRSAALGQIALGTLTLYLVAFRQGQQALQSVLGGLGSVYDDTLYMSNLFEYLDLPIEEASAPALPEATIAPERGIRFEAVGFRYPSASPEDQSERWALRRLDLFVPEGQAIALVGQNGAGKTTLIKLLTRLYDPTEGRVLLDGKDLRQWDREALQARVAVVFQDFNRYQFTVKENVGLGSWPHLAEEARVARAVERGGAAALVAELDDGLDTKVGKWAHEGVELSGGQWQKLALARAFMREQADILILDEPTAALDPEAERAVFSRLREVASGRTTFVISHRFSTVRMADRILVIEDGRITEDGSHTELLRSNARYAHLFRLQAEGYA